MDREELKWFIFGSIISADNPDYTEDVKQEVIYRYKLQDKSDPDWEFVLEPLGADNRLLKLFID